MDDTLASYNPSAWMAVYVGMESSVADNSLFRCLSNDGAMVVFKEKKIVSQSWRMIRVCSIYPFSKTTDLPKLRQLSSIANK